MCQVPLGWVTPLSCLSTPSSGLDPKGVLLCLSKGLIVLHFTCKSMVHVVNLCRRREVGGRVWFVYGAGGACGCLKAPAPLTGKPSLHGAAAALSQTVGGVGGACSVLWPVPPAPAPVRIVRLSRAFVFPDNFRARLLLFSENLLTAWSEASSAHGSV